MSRWMPETVEQRLLAKTNKAGPVPTAASHLGPCWLFTGYLDPKHGYGHMWVDGKMRSTHRLAWEAMHGDIPSGTGHHGTCVLHRCDNPACVNPGHLFLGTNLDNVRDRDAKGRQARLRGERCGRATLTLDQVRAMCASIQRGSSQADAGREFGIGIARVNAILHGRIWPEASAEAAEALSAYRARKPASAKGGKP